MNSRSPTVRARLLRATLVPLGVAVVLLVGLSSVLLQKELRRQAENSLLSLSDVMANNVAVPLAFDYPDETALVLSSLRARSDIVHAWVYTADGRIYKRYPDDAAGAGAGAGDATLPTPGLRYAGDRLRAAAPVVMRDGEVIGFFEVESDMGDLRVLTRRLLAGTLLGLVLALAVAAGLALRMRRGILDPVLRLDQAARRVSEEQDYAVRVSDVGGDELGRMGAAFNEMLDRIEEHERVLRERESYFRSLIENSTDMILVVDDDGTVSYLSPSVRRILGYELEGASRLRFDELVHPQDREAVSAVYGREAPDGPRAITTRAVTMDGSVRTIEAVGVRHRRSSGRASWILNARDVTDRIRSEEERDHLTEQLIQAQKMEAVGQLTGGVAHDFNNLLTVVVGNLELLDMVADLDEESAELTEGALKAAHRGAALTQRLLAFSRRQSLRPEALNAAELVRGMTDLLNRTLGATIRIEFDAPEDLWPCRADPVQLESAILNLSINARDAMPDGGTLHISCRNLSCADATEEGAADDCVEIRVRDTGTGIAPEQLERVFEPFFTTKEVGRGTGLGLSMVYGFARQSGGRVEIESEVGEGTLVRVLLPRSDETMDAQLGDGVRDAGADAGMGEQVLLVEDDPDVRLTTIRLLESMGFRVQAATHGPEALTRLERLGPVSLVVTDVVLPAGMSGVELAGKIRDRFPGLPIVFTSGYARDHLMEGGTIEADIELVHKPFTQESLGRAIRKALLRADPTKDATAFGRAVDPGP